MDFLFFFCVFVYFYFVQFFVFSYFSLCRLLILNLFVLIKNFIGVGVDSPLTYVVNGFYFFVMIVICYVGHFSWNLSFCRMAEFVFVWSFVGWLMVVFLFLSEEVFSNFLGLYGEGYLGVMYAIFGKVISVLVRPISLSLRLLINLTVGHVFMFMWVCFCQSLMNFSFVFNSFILVFMHLVLMLIVVYEYFVFFLQSFIFSRLLGVYLEEY